MSKGALSGRNVVVLGASAGIGRAIAIECVAQGANTLLCGRRRDRLEDVQRTAGGGTICQGDITVASELSRLVDDVQGFGSVDSLISTVGTSPLKRIEQMTETDWLSVMSNNVVAMNLVITSVLPHLADGAMVVAFSSETVKMPRWAMSAYAASKAALEVSLAGWRCEHPRVRFGTVTVGAAFPTDFARDFDMDLLGPALELWACHGLTHEAMMDPEEVGRSLVGIVASLLPNPSVNMEHIVLRTPSPISGTTELLASLGDGK